MNEETTNNASTGQIAGWRKSRKARMWIIVGLLAVVALLAFLFESLRIWMFGIGLLLLAALGLEAAQTDIDMGSLLDGNSVSESMIERDADGNLVENDEGGLMTSIWRDENGFEVAEGTAGAKGEDAYNCSDFFTQPQAQTFFDNAGGVANDINGLDGNKDGVPCQALPAG